MDSNFSTSFSCLTHCISFGKWSKTGEMECIVHILNYQLAWQLLGLYIWFIFLSSIFCTIRSASCDYMCRYRAKYFVMWRGSKRHCLMIKKPPIFKNSSQNGFILNLKFPRLSRDSGVLVTQLFQKNVHLVGHVKSLCGW